MNNNSKQPTVSVGLVKIVRSYAASLGVEFKPAAVCVGFDPEALQNGQARIPGPVFEALWLKIAALGDDPHPGLSFGKQAAGHFPEGGLLFSLMRNCPAIGQALEVFVRYHRVMADTIQPKCRKYNTSTHLSWDLSVFSSPVRPHLSEALLCTYHSILDNLSQGRITPIKVCFTHPGPDRPENRRAYERFFKAPVRFKTDTNELVIDSRDLDIRIELADASLCRVLERHAAQLMTPGPFERQWARKVSGMISEWLLSGRVPDLTRVARALAVGKRTLQDKLKAEGTSFRGLLQAVRKQVAIEQLDRREVSICEAAFLLGYSEQSAFNHAFRKWTGQSPKAFMKNRLKAG